MIKQKEISFKKGDYKLIDIRTFPIESYDVDDLPSSVRFINEYYKLNEIDREINIVLAYNGIEQLEMVYELGIGTYDQAPFYNRNLALFALLSHCDQFRIIHNHPNDVLNNSNDDLIISNIVLTTLSLFDLKYLGSIIISSEGYRELGKEIVLY